MVGVIHHTLKRRLASFPPQLEGKWSLCSVATDLQEGGAWPPAWPCLLGLFNWRQAWNMLCSLLALLLGTFLTGTLLSGKPPFKSSLSLNPVNPEPQLLVWFSLHSFNCLEWIWDFMTGVLGLGYLCLLGRHLLSGVPLPTDPLPRWPS